MSQPLAPRPTQADGPYELSSSQRPRKISTACGACKQRKTKCTGGNPCEACATRRSLCVYDATSDQRRKIANQRNVQELADKQLDLEKHQQLLGGIIATIRAGGFSATEDLVRVIRSDVDLSQLAAHVRNECRANMAIQQAFEKIDFVIDGGPELPSPTQLQVMPGDLGPKENSLGSEVDSDTSSANMHSSSGKKPRMDRQIS
ncbi:putative C6 finger domain protein [Cladophialophora carrionii]|uniref:Putative C6 finger domain protein n=1 Tax=Cladophialophora carrionii TaxID=86049 RepID=A0A1C1CYB9_9EURO|nr:putative C6 finger domain protein [Cladophialophora carrionii]